MDLYFAILCGVTFMLAPLGMVFQIVKIWKRGTPPTAVNRLPLIAHIARFLVWGLVGAISLDKDPVIRWMFMLTRIPAAGLAITGLIQLNCPRPSLIKLVVKVLIPIFLTIVACICLAQIPEGSFREHLQSALKLLVVVSFIALTLILVPRKIFYILNNWSFGMFRLFEIGILPNFILTFLLGFMAKDRELGIVMIACYALAIVVQLILVSLVEYGRFSYRKETSSTE